MELNFDVAFAENGQKSDISDDKWLQGWVEIVGGINGVPTAQQFNQFGYVFDKKANIAYAKALEAASNLTNKADKTYVDEKLEGKADSTDFDNHKSDTTAHVTTDEKSRWNAKADKSDIPSALPANGGNADTLDGKHASNFLTGAAIAAVNSLDDLTTPGVYGVHATEVSGALEIYGAWGLCDVRIYGSVCYQTIKFETGNIINRAKIIGQSEWTEWAKVNDGGNADTVDGKHAGEFMQYLGNLEEGSLLDHVLTMTSSGWIISTNKVTDVPVSGQFFWVEVRADKVGDYCVTATRFNNPSSVYTNRYNGGLKAWYGWANTADGGNAATAVSAGASASASAGNSCLRNLSSGSDKATAANCPVGAWYGQYEE